MNSYIESIYMRGTVSNGEEVFPLESSVSPAEGALIERVIAETRPKVYVEVGLAYGISALYAAKALSNTGVTYTHHVIDPAQHTDWHGVGMYNLMANGFSDNTILHEMGSEQALPLLEQQGIEIDAAFIDGWHTFDHALVDFFYINRMLRVGGVVMFDDANWCSVNKLLRYIEKYPCYERFGSAGGFSFANAFSRIKEGRYPSWRTRCVALRKITKDERSWKWYCPF